MRMLTRRIVRIGLIPIAAAGLLVTPTVAFAASPVVGHVYVNDNTAGANTIGGWISTPTVRSRRWLAHRSPREAPGPGRSSARRGRCRRRATGDSFWRPTPAATNSVLAVASDGSLTPAPGSPVSSGGIEPVSIAVHGGLVYVANEGDGTSGSNFTGFTLAGDGRLTPLSDSTFALPPTALPGDILFNGTGKNLIGIEVGPIPTEHLPDR